MSCLLLIVEYIVLCSEVYTTPAWKIAKFERSWAHGWSCVGITSHLNHNGRRRAKRPHTLALFTLVFRLFSGRTRWFEVLVIFDFFAPWYKKVERHFLWKFHNKIWRKSWSNTPPKLLACIRFLYKVVYKHGRLRKFNRAREIEFTFFTAWTICMKLGTLVHHVPGYNILPQILPRDLVMVCHTCENNDDNTLPSCRIWVFQRYWYW